MVPVYNTYGSCVKQLLCIFALVEQFAHFVTGYQINYPCMHMVSEREKILSNIAYLKSSTYSWNLWMQLACNTSVQNDTEKQHFPWPISNQRFMGLIWNIGEDKPFSFSTMSCTSPPRPGLSLSGRKKDFCLSPIFVWRSSTWYTGSMVSLDTAVSRWEMLG